jgi:hypothetical protein
MRCFDKSQFIHGKWAAGAMLAIGVFTVAPVNAQVNYAGKVLFPLLPANTAGFGNLDMANFSVNAGQAVGSTISSGETTQPFIWNSPNGTATNLSPTNLSGYTTSAANDTNGVEQVGYDAIIPFHNFQHALLWHGTAGSAVDLNPTNINDDNESVAEAISANGKYQVGYAYASIGAYYQPVLWSGTAASAVDLSPNPGFQALALGVNSDGSQQVGFGYFVNVPSVTEHALLWSGTAASMVDLNPAQVPGLNTEALGVGGGQQVGFGQGSANGAAQHAYVWSGTAASAVDLNPTGFTYSQANSTNGSIQVGWAGAELNISYQQAFLWQGTPGTAVNLQSLLPGGPGQWLDSDSYHIDASGNVYGEAEGTFDGQTNVYAVEWSPVPEPTAISLLLIAAGSLLPRRRSSRQTA